MCAEQCSASSIEPSILKLAYDRGVCSEQKLHKIKRWKYSHVAEFLKCFDEFNELRQVIKAMEICGTQFLTAIEADILPLWCNCLDSNGRRTLRQLGREIRAVLNQQKHKNDQLVEDTSLIKDDIMNNKICTNHSHSSGDETGGESDNSLLSNSSSTMSTFLHHPNNRRRHSLTNLQSVKRTSVLDGCSSARRRRKTIGAIEYEGLTTLEDYFPRLDSNITGYHQNYQQHSLSRQNSDRFHRNNASKHSMILSYTSGVRRQEFAKWMIACCDKLIPSVYSTVTHHLFWDKVKENTMFLHNENENALNDDQHSKSNLEKRDIITPKRMKSKKARASQQNQQEQDFSHSTIQKNVFETAMESKHSQTTQHTRFLPWLRQEEQNKVIVIFQKKPKNFEDIDFLVVASDQLRPTLKILYCLASKKYILAESFMHAALEKHSWPIPFLHEHKQWPTVDKRLQPISSLESDEKRNELLEDISFTTLGSFSPPSMSKNDVMRLMTLLGAVYRPASLASYCDVVITSDGLTMSDVTSIHKIVALSATSPKQPPAFLVSSNGRPVFVTVLWLVDTLSRWEIQDTQRYEHAIAHSSRSTTPLESGLHNVKPDSSTNPSTTSTDINLSVVKLRRRRTRNQVYEEEKNDTAPFLNEQHHTTKRVKSSNVVSRQQKPHNLYPTLLNLESIDSNHFETTNKQLDGLLLNAKKHSDIEADSSQYFNTSSPSACMSDNEERSHIGDDSSTYQNKPLENLSLSPKLINSSKENTKEERNNHDVASSSPKTILNISRHISSTDDKEIVDVVVPVEKKQEDIIEKSDFGSNNPMQSEITRTRRKKKELSILQRRKKKEKIQKV